MDDKVGVPWRREMSGRDLDRLIVDSATDFAMIATDVDGHVTRWNPGAEKVLGWTEAEMLGEPLERIFTPEDRAIDRALTEMRLARETGRANDERWHLREDGNRFWAQGEMTPLRSADGVLGGYVKVLRDRTTERLREERLSLLVKASDGLLSGSDPDAVNQAVLESGIRSLGFDQSFTYALSEDGRHLRLIYSVNVPQEQQEQLRHAPFTLPLCGIVAEQREPLILNKAQLSSSSRYEVAYNEGITAYAGYPLRGRADLFGVISFASFHCNQFDPEALTFFSTLARFLAVGRERLENEGTLRNLAHQLEVRVDERTRELLKAEETLRHSQKMEAIGQLTGGVAHDFNNLLTVIRGSVDLLRRGNLAPEKHARYIDAIADTAARATKLTGQLLAFARRQALKPEVFDAVARANNVADMIDTITGARVAVRLRLPTTPCYVRADLSQFETALVNMAVNARDAMDGAGTLTIEVRCGASLPPLRGHAGSPGKFVAVSLTDTGTGITSGDLQRIFEPFFTTKDVGKGTGLGLSQAFGFAKQSGGDIEVTSEAGAGATFTLYLPEAENGPEAIDERPAGTSSGEGAGLCVLVVEDNEEVGRFSTQALEELGYETRWVATAEEALSVLEGGKAGFDVVFSDVVMPGIGGLELAKRLSRDMPELPVVLASGYSHVIAQEGSHGFTLVHKPYSADEVSRVLRAVTSESAR
ncbi:PAS domain S-box protein [Sphingomonas sp. RRHST34]|uniref:histidine kinase n=1 Tax=Sphingomonas citri TaxID=2862499 RepID=A0ABS7BLQ6_9SPHN|nr:ATP-binding protein [Sphingomonas citri]MBW6530420.1 PAS domain S-box protein [Sphingomonas citri]